MQWVPVWFCLILGWSKKHYYKVSLDTSGIILFPVLVLNLPRTNIFLGVHTHEIHMYFFVGMTLPSSLRRRNSFINLHYISSEQEILFESNWQNAFHNAALACYCCSLSITTAALGLRSKTRITAVQCKIQIMFAIDLGQSGSSESVSFHLRSWHQSHWVLWCYSNAVRRKH